MIWLVGAGSMAIEYTLVMKSLGCVFSVIGRGHDSSHNFHRKTGIKAISGGIEKYCEHSISIPDMAIVAVGVDRLFDVTKYLLNSGVKKILVEKPGFLTSLEAEEIQLICAEKKADVYIAYNRRCYASVEKALGIIKEDGGVKSFQFEFTEWSHVIEGLQLPEIVKENWFLANSTHVVDMAFFLCGKPMQIDCYTSNAINWHSRSAIFTGAGVTEYDALFSYVANWTSAGRWAIEVNTSKRRLIFKPLERLKIQNIGETRVTDVDIDYSIDNDYKPGLYMQVKKFLNNELDHFCHISEQLAIFPIYEKMAGYV